MSKMARFLGILVAVCIIASGVLAGCTFTGGDVITGSGRATTKDYDFSGFTKVSVGSAFQTTITRGEGYRVSVTVDDNLVEYLDVHVDGATLNIGLKPSLRLGFGNITAKAEITMPDVEALDLSGATRTQVSGFSNTKTVDVEVSGASRLNGDMTTGQLQLHVSGASTVEITGTTGPLDIEASGASTIRLDNYTSTDTHVRASGASNITVNASGKISGDASGASTIRYAGSPASVLVDTSGASSVKQK